MLTSVKISELIMGILSNAVPVQMLVNYHLRYIQSRMKVIHMIPSNYIFLKFLHNYYFIVMCYKINIIVKSMKVTFYTLCM